MVSCKKETKTITETVTVYDTIYVQSTDTLIQLLEDTTTTLICVRHAETTGSGSNPNLSTLGQNRAQTLSDLLIRANLEAVYSTNYNRTSQTAQPIANDQGLTTQTYDGFGLDALVDDVFDNHLHKNVLVVGHSNTTPSLLNLLIGSNVYSNIPETEYDNLFIVSVLEKGRAKVLHVKYGL